MIVSTKQVESKRYRLIDGQWHKLCNGESHEEPTWLPATDKYFYIKKSGPTAGRPVARCRLCHNWSKLKNPTKGSLHGYVPVDKVRPFYIEAVNRIGVKELCNRSGLSVGHVLRVLTELDKQFVLKSRVRLVMLELVSMQRKHESYQSPRSKWRTDRRNNGILGTCGGCGGPRRNATIGCDACNRRFYDWYRHGKITKKEWESVKLRFFNGSEVMHHGIVYK